MKITLVDGSVREYSEKKMAFDIAMDISEGLGRAACAAEIDGKVCDLLRTCIYRCIYIILL